MMPFTRFVLLLILCCTIRSGFGFKLYKINDSYTCNELLSEVGKEELPEDTSVDKRSFTYLPSDRSAFAADKEKRIFPAARYKYLRRTQLKGKMYQNTAKSNRRTKFTLSLDVPTSILNILLNIAKAKNMRAKAAANARLMAQIGRRK
ncbi:urocortin 3, like [Callorhinchus milii]|uniref:Urocortin 3, like n=1 Tax=Callorhinchus milii TaxID=7868 RepID=A0A4W3J8K9_CALMI|nr:urocortin 3, like [Callorhinchus milii]XP_007889031.1 urocortin 3, like [Callorhinchus milii]|eukprot:gi/632947408/ref/XP_007889030.1/ PREDICTED: urocortin-3-like [Callorhinchus milii]